MLQSTGDDAPDVAADPDPEKRPREEAAANVGYVLVLFHKPFPRFVTCGSTG